jgi:nucleotide-binding universal stress UspA family protein
MIPKINKILYATDLSKNSAYAFRYAIKSAEVHDAKIDILNILEIPRYMSEMDWSAELAVVSEETKAINMGRIRKGWKKSFSGN